VGMGRGGGGEGGGAGWGGGVLGFAVLLWIAWVCLGERHWLVRVLDAGPF